MPRFIEGCDRVQRLLLPDCIDDDVGEDSTVRVVDVFIDELDLPERLHRAVRVVHSTANIACVDASLRVLHPHSRRTGRSAL